jgi:alpha-mannosidase
VPYSYDKFEPQRTLAKIDAAIYAHLQPLRVEAWLTPEPVPYEQRTSGTYRELALGQPWGSLWECAWMHVTGAVPASAREQKVVLLIDINGEALVYDDSGTAVLSLTTVNSDFDLSLGWPGKRVVDVTNSARGGEVIDLWMDTGANDLFGKLPENGILREAHVAICHETMRKLFHDYFVLEELTRQLPEQSARRIRIWRALYDAAQLLVAYSDDEAAAAREILAPELAKVGGTPSLTVSGIGHAHIDLGWLWPIRETIRKGGRTFATAIAMMDRYPDYVFGASQAQLYQWVKDYYPGVYAKVKQKIAEGRWEIQGGMWVEPDMNISGGEALVRQFLYGKRFWHDEFGKATRMLWLPDVFGYNGALPQIMKKSEIDYFMTIKISWSKFNTFPHHTFWWEGIDGSKVLAHMPPEGTYNSAAAPRSIAAIEREYRDKYVSENALLLFGIGDGGAGPGESHLENLARMKNLEGLPPVIQEPAEAFFHRLEPNAAEYKTWAGELYLEYHQGTLTTQARNKRFNRKLEYALRELEWLGVWASAVDSGYAYPTETLDAIWREMLLYQFHDILPGSSITRVYDESLARYQILMDETKALTDTARTALIAQIDTSALKNPVVISNALSWECKQWLKIGDTWMKAHVPPMGYAALELTASPIDAENLHADYQGLENELIRVQIGGDGSISSVFDKVHGREVLPPGSSANTLDVYEDGGNAWDFAFDYRVQTPQRFTLVGSDASIDGPRAILHQTYTYGASSLSQQIILTLGSRRLDFVTEVDWQENGKMLRTRFPLDIHAWEATCDIQFGSIKRPTHQNTTWDMAKYEIAAHKWVDLSQRDYGVALLNDCKYGYHIEQGVIDLNLLRSPHSPDPVGDRAHHQFTYSLFPHKGDHVEGNVAHAAYMLNIPLQATVTDAHKGTLPASASLITVDAPNVVVEAVKRSEDGKGIVVRLYESQGASVAAHVTFSGAASAELTNLVETSITPLDVTENGIAVDFHSFEIQTLKVK